LPHPPIPQDLQWSHVTHLPQIRRAQAPADAALSPEVAAGQEFERVVLTVNFLWRYRVIRMSVWAGYAPLPQMDGLSNLLSGFRVRLEEAMKEMGERAAVVAEMVSSPDRRRIHPA